MTPSEAEAHADVMRQAIDRFDLDLVATPDLVVCEIAAGDFMMRMTPAGYSGTISGWTDSGGTYEGFRVFWRIAEGHDRIPPMTYVYRPRPGR